MVHYCIRWSGVEGKAHFCSGSLVHLTQGELEENDIVSDAWKSLVHLAVQSLNQFARDCTCGAAPAGHATVITPDSLRKKTQADSL